MNLNFYKLWPGRRHWFILLTVTLLVSHVFAGTLSADVTVTGKVTSADDGSPLPGVNVYLKGTQTGTITDGEGNYTLAVSDENGTLVFSYIGFTTQEVLIGGRTSIDINLQPSLEALQEVVVTALGIEREQKSLGYSVGKVDGSSITQVAQENVLSGMQGKIAGVTINQIGTVGSSTSIVIRGAKSLSTDNQPLFVIDGVPVSNQMNNFRVMGDRNEVDYGNAINDLNPDNVESVSVLKGPAAAALYGSRAGNGVILITTKKGKKGDGLGISFSTSNIFEKPVEFLKFHYKYGTGERNSQLDEGSAYWGGPELDKGLTAEQWNSPLDENGDPIPTELRSYKDNMKNFLETGITSTNNLSLSGSSDKMIYRINLEHMRNNGMIPNSDLKRNSISTSTTYDITKAVKLSANLNVSRTGSNSRPSTGNRGANPLEAVYFYPHVDVRDLKDYWVPGMEDIQQKAVHPSNDNPYFLANELTNGFQRDRAFGNIKLDFQITPEISGFARVSQDYFNETRETKIPRSYSRVRGGGYHVQDLAFRETNADILFTYKQSVTPDFDFSVSAGGNYMKQHNSDNYTGSANGPNVLTIPGLYRLSNIPNALLIANNAVYDKAIYSVYGMTSLGYKGMLYLDLTARNDWSSTLPAENRSYFYPSASLSWLANYTFNLPEEVSLLKFRAGWAQAGNDTRPYQLETQLGTGSWGSLVTTNVPANLLNPQLKPEIATSQELGIDLNLFNNRIRLEATYYSMTNKNQIFSIPSPASSGYTSRLINAGEILSEGWEIQLGGTPIQSASGWKLDLNVNLSRNRTTLEELADGLDYITFWDDNGGGSFAREGDQLGNLYSRGYAKVEDPNSPYYLWPILDDNGEWIAVNDHKKREKVGNYNPDVLIGFQPTLSYKRFTLSASFDWRIGGQFQSYTYRYGESDWKSQRQIDNLIAAGISPDEMKADPEKYIIPSNGDFPRVGGYTQETGGVLGEDGTYDNGFAPGVIEVSEGVYEEHLGGPNTKIYPITYMYPWSFNKQITFDADFLKLRELALTYSIPQLFGLRNASVSIFTRNIMLWTKSDIGIDPERAFQVIGNSQGNTVNSYRQGIELQNVMPWTVSYGFKLNLSL
jgi:TonB-linked SusC/RagA family outer membrane protein